VSEDIPIRAYRLAKAALALAVSALGLIAYCLSR